MMETLLTEIVSNIFSRLTFDTVMQCRCVSKSWYNLIQLLIHTSGDLYFANTHRSRLLEENHLNSSSISSPDSILLLLDQSGVDNYEQLCFAEYDNKQQPPPLVVKKFNSPVLFNMNSKFWTMASSSNGLVCSAVHHHYKSDDDDDDDDSYMFYIYNPFLREYVTLPKLKSAESNSMAFGFGYVPSTGEYKVVRIFYPISRGGDGDSTVGNVEVYTLGNMGHVWRSKGSIQHRLKVSSPGVLINGSLHWLTTDDKVVLPDDIERKQHDDILAFDLLKEEFYSVPLPPSKCLTNFQIKEFEGCLCGINNVRDERTMEMWIMENYHMKKKTKESSWKNLFWIRWGGDEGLEQCFYWNKVDQFLLWSNSSLIRVDIDKWLGPKLSGKDPICARFFHGIPHTKSFVSLKALGEDDAITIRLDNNRKRKCYFESTKTTKMNTRNLRKTNLESAVLTF